MNLQILNNQSFLKTVTRSEKNTQVKYREIYFLFRKFVDIIQFDSRTIKCKFFLKCAPVSKFVENSCSTSKI